MSKKIIFLSISSILIILGISGYRYLPGLNLKSSILTENFVCSVENYNDESAQEEYQKSITRHTVLPTDITALTATHTKNNTALTTKQALTTTLQKTIDDSEAKITTLKACKPSRANRRCKQEKEDITKLQDTIGKSKRDIREPRRTVSQLTKLIREETKTLTTLNTELTQITAGIKNYEDCGEVLALVTPGDTPPTVPPVTPPPITTPLASAPAHYIWTVAANEWTTCSAPCGGGTQQSPVYKCKEEVSDTLVNDSHCEGVENTLGLPSQTQACNTQACPVSTCTNGATNHPICTTCPTGKTLEAGQCILALSAAQSEPLSCDSTPSGGTRTQVRYRSATVQYGSTCESQSETQTQTCNNGNWSAWTPSTATAATCHVDPPANCGTITHGNTETRNMYRVSSVPFGQSCDTTPGNTITQTRTCTNGDLGEWVPTTTFTQATCEVARELVAPLVVQDTYTWVASDDYTTCTATCGPGTQTQVYQCRKNGDNIVADSFCRGTVKPTPTKACNLGVCASGELCINGATRDSQCQTCPAGQYNKEGQCLPLKAVWRTKNRQLCQSPCGTPLSSTDIVCSNRDYETYNVDDTYCAGITKPQQVNEDVCRGQYETCLMSGQKMTISADATVGIRPGIEVFYRIATNLPSNTPISVSIKGVRGTAFSQVLIPKEHNTLLGDFISTGGKKPEVDFLAAGNYIIEVTTYSPNSPIATYSSNEFGVSYTNISKKILHKHPDHGELINNKVVYIHRKGPHKYTITIDGKESPEYYFINKVFQLPDDSIGYTYEDPTLTYIYTPNRSLRFHYEYIAFEDGSVSKAMGGSISHATIFLGKKWFIYSKAENYSMPTYVCNTDNVCVSSLSNKRGGGFGSIFDFNGKVAYSGDDGYLYIDYKKTVNINFAKLTESSITRVNGGIIFVSMPIGSNHYPNAPITNNGYGNVYILFTDGRTIKRINPSQNYYTIHEIAKTGENTIEYKGYSLVHPKGILVRGTFGSDGKYTEQESLDAPSLIGSSFLGNIPHQLSGANTKITLTVLAGIFVIMVGVALFRRKRRETV